MAPINKLSIVMAADFGALFLGEKLNLMNWLGVVFIVTGVSGTAFYCIRLHHPHMQRESRTTEKH